MQQDNVTGPQSSRRPAFERGLMMGLLEQAASQGDLESLKLYVQEFSDVPMMAEWYEVIREMAPTYVPPLDLLVETGSERIDPPSHR